MSISPAKKRPQPPTLAVLLLRICLPAETRDPVIGDLNEEYQREAIPELGTFKAKLWYFRQTLSLANCYFWEQLKQFRVTKTIEVGNSKPRGTSMDTLRQDLRYAVRTVSRRPGFTVIVVLTMALGIGASSALFSVANAVMFRPLPFNAPSQLAMVWENNPQFKREGVIITPARFLFWREQAKSFDQLAAISTQVFSLTNIGEPERVRGGLVTSNFFSLLGVPIIGRGFSPEDAQARSPRVCVLNRSLWARRFGARPDVLGQEITLNGARYTVVGILPSNVQLPIAQVDLWLPLTFEANAASDWGSHLYYVMGRVKAGVTLEQAEAALRGMNPSFEQQFPQTKGWDVSLVPLQQQGVTEVRQALFILLGAVGFLLLIACANVANLLLVRATGRGREIAIRAALGANRFRLARQLLTESLLLNLLGALAGLLFAYWAVRFFILIGPKGIPRFQEANLDWRVLAFTLIVAMTTGLISGLAPVVKTLKVDLTEALKGGSQGFTGAPHSGTRSAILVAEISLSLVLLIGAGLLIKSYVLLRNINSGLKTDHVLTVSLALPFSKYSTLEQRAGFVRDLLSRVTSLPGVEAAGATNNLPLSGSEQFFYIGVEGIPLPRPGEPFLRAESHTVTPDYFKSLGIPLLKGRFFTERDMVGATNAMIINQHMAQQFFPHADPIGKKISILANNEQPREIVGVVGDVRHENLTDEMKSQMYVPYTQFLIGGITLTVRTAGDPLSLAASIKNAVWAIDKDQPISRISTMETWLGDTVSPQRFNTLLLGVFAGVALLLASVGIYGVMAYSVAQSTREIGVRLALGAQRRDILKLIMGQAMLLSLIGLGLGLFGTFVMTRLLTKLLFGVSPTDPVIFIAVSVFFMLVAMAASYFPAWRATKVDPMVTLRYE